MDQFNIFVNFITQHWILSTLFGVLLLAIIVHECLQSFLGIKSLSVEETVQLINHRQAVILDVRTESEFKMGHITHAINIPFAFLGTKIHILKKHLKHPMVIVSDVGQVPNIAKTLKKEGFTELYVLRGGLQAWKQASLPLIKK